MRKNKPFNGSGEAVYAAPSIELIEIEIEKGFADSTFTSSGLLDEDESDHHDL